VKRLNGMDAMLLYSETANLHTHTLKIAVIDGADAWDYGTGVNSRCSSLSPRMMNVGS
jgi:hypothetical protein